MPKEAVQKTTQAAASRLRSFVNRLNRARKTRVRLPKSSKRKSLRQQPLVSSKQVFRGVKWSLLLFVIVVVGFIGVIVWKVASGINLSPSVLASAAEAPPLMGDQTSILLVGYDTNDRYSFVDFLAVLSLNHKESKQQLIILNPDFTTTLVDGKNVRYRNILNNALVKELPPLDTLQRAVEIMLGMHIDRYITADIAGLPAALQSLGITYVSPEGLVDSDAGEYRQDQMLKDDVLVKYLAADEPGHNSKMIRLGKFAKTQMEANSSIWRLVGLVLNPEPWTKFIATNASKMELLNWALSMMNNASVQYITISTTDGVYYPDLTGGYYVPITLEIDQKMQANFVRSLVVKEQGRVEVYNATLTPGLANITKRFLVNQGATVIRTGNYSDKQERSKLYVPQPDKFVNTVNFIKEEMRGEVIVVNEVYPFNHTGDMVLVIGEDAVD